MRNKSNEISDLILKRINNGDYAYNSLPSSRRLASELGVSYVTARKALQKLIDVGWLKRSETGKLELGQKLSTRMGVKIAFVTPAFASAAYFSWLQCLRFAASERGWLVRHITYSHWNDPVINDVLTGDFDGIVLIPPVDVSSLMESQLAQYSHKVVTLFHDFTSRGIPCVDGVSTSYISLLIDHLTELGHKSIDCINVQPQNNIIDARIDCWAENIESRGISGELHNIPVNPFEDSAPQARRLMGRLIDSGRLKSKAVFCTTVRGAVGTMRAIADRKLIAGKDISVCSFGEVQEAELLIPSLTVVRNPDPSACLSKALDWIESKGKGWNGSLMIRPAVTDLFCGESTGRP